MLDETEPPFSPTPGPAPAESTTTVAKTVTESTTVGKPLSDETMFGNASGRFWIAAIFSVGIVLAVLLMITALLFGKFPSDPVVLAAVLSVFTGFLGGASTLVGMYMGQNQKPKTQTQ